MAGCGYVCPICEGRGYTEDNLNCKYCKDDKPKGTTNYDCGTDKESLEDWINSVHEGPCCGNWTGKI